MAANNSELTEAQLLEACAAWGWTPSTGGGSVGLSSWMRRTFGHFSVEEYARMVQRVRQRTGDNQDYSTYYESEEARTLWPELSPPAALD